MMFGRHSSARGGGKRGGGPVISVGQPGSASTIGYNPATDTLLKQDTMQYTSENSNYVGPTSNWHKLKSPTANVDVTPYDVVLDASASTDATYPIGVKRRIYSVQTAINNATWSCAGDADCGIEGGMFGGTIMGDDSIGSVGGYNFWFSYRRKWPVGFRWSAFSPTTLSPNCARMSSYKEWLVFREASGGAGGRFTLTAGIHRNGTELNGTVGVDWLTNPALMWCIDFAPTATSQKPTAATTARYGQTQNNQLRGVDKTPDACADGAEHELVFYVRNESVEDAGDGACKMWVDGLQVYDCDGLDPTSSASGVCYTRVRAWKTVQWGSTINGGGISDQTDWFLGPVRAWSRP